MAYANSADPDQTTPEKQSDQSLHCLSFHYVFKKQLHKKQNLGQIGMEKKKGSKFLDIYYNLFYHICLVCSKTTKTLIMAILGMNAQADQGFLFSLHGSNIEIS